jgi:hypothetical protein
VPDKSFDPFQVIGFKSPASFAALLETEGF